MNGDPLKKVRQGDALSIPAATFNAFIDATLWYKGQQQNQGGGAPADPFDPSVVLVKNSTGGNLDRFAVLGVDVPLILPTDNPDGFKERIAFAGVSPVAGTHEGKFLVTLQPIAGGAIGRAVASGACPVQINVTDAAHAYAEIADGVTASLASGTAGSATILWKASGTGVVWAVVRVGNLGGSPPMRWGKLKTAWSSTATVTLTPVVAYNDATATGDPDVTCSIFGNFTNPVVPPMFHAAVNDVLGYHPYGTDLGVLAAPPLMKKEGSQYQGWFRDSAGLMVNDYVRAS